MDSFIDCLLEARSIKRRNKGMCTNLGGGVLGQRKTEFGSMSFPQGIKVGFVAACALPTYAVP